MEPLIPKRVQRGGSFMCSDTYCIGYSVHSRMKGEPTSGSFHNGFRCVVDSRMLDIYRKAPRQRMSSTRSASDIPYVIRLIRGHYK
jgi:hypothetical protein